jgi:hypothetical protein
MVMGVLEGWNKPMPKADKRTPSSAVVESGIRIEQPVKIWHRRLAVICPGKSRSSVSDGSSSPWHTTQ